MNIRHRAGPQLLAAALVLTLFASVDAYAADLEFTYLTAYTASGSFTSPQTGMYKIYCVGKSGSGYASIDYNGGGGGSGGIAVSELILEAGTAYNFTITTGKTSWHNDQLYATAGADSSGSGGGTGGTASGGNVANDNGFSGGRGGSSGNGWQYSGLTYGSNGSAGGNGGMSGGQSGYAYSNGSNSSSVHGGGGGGGGARLPDTNCKYVAKTFTTYNAGSGGSASMSNYHSGNSTRGRSASSYPGLNISNLILYSGGGGGGGKSYATYGSSKNGSATGLGGSSSSGTPGVLIIEKCTDTTPPTIESIEFSGDRKSVIITGSDDYGVAGFYINGTFAEGNPPPYFILSGTVQLAIQAKDNAGNRSAEQMVDVLPSAPCIAVSPDKPWLNASDGNAVVTFTTDAVGIFDDVKLWYSLDGGAGWTVYTVPLEINETRTVSAKVSCTNGDSGTAQKEIQIDSLPPSVASAVVDETDMENRFLTVMATDTGGSGEKNIWIDEVQHTENPCVYSIPNGQKTVTLKVEDVAGNLSKSVEQIVRHIDTIPPTIDSVDFTADKSVVTIRMSDDTYGEGVKGVTINGTFKTGNPILWAVPEDLAILHLQAEDNAGNQSEVLREHVPGRTTILNTITIESVIFSENNTTATVTATTSETGTSITGIYCNDELLTGNPVTYTIPVDNSQYLKVQAVNNEGDRSELITKRVPGWSEVVDTIAVTSVEFFNSNKMARVRADTTRLNARISGIYVNSLFYAGNPIEYAVATGTTYLECQAVDDTGDLSQSVVRSVPSESTGSSHSGGHSSGGSGSTNGGD